MTQKRKYKWNVIRSIRYIGDAWSHYVLNEIVSTKAYVIEHVESLNNDVHPAAREYVRYSYERAPKGEKSESKS